ncbi:EcoRII N-terminal effector-binding domain-containing protein [Fodinibius sp. AD559]|uniref:EcoRII N-terminal effector-binding domain-containing protein n=1 Tax=Fodinibius sp. AD559 TaxID=3424179 RepID=UPI004046BC17
MERTKSISKELTKNDTGETGAHQAGTHIPKQEEILSFFPPLTKDTKNPRHSITFTDPMGEKWSFNYIYYNNKFFGGTRNEYRLTGMTKFMRRHNLKAGDELILERDDDGFYFIDFEKENKTNTGKNGKLKLGSSWKVVNI